MVTATLSEAVDVADSREAIVLVGASPDAPRSDDGWIVPDGAPDSTRASERRSNLAKAHARAQAPAVHETAI